MEKSEDFQKIIDDFVKDLLISFPEYEDKFNVIDYDEYYCHCKKVYPENFFHILYENDELFDSDDSCFLLPDLNFKEIILDDKLSDGSKKTIWKYLQLILFSVCKGVDNKEDFGSAKDLFEAINEEDLQDKIEETMNEMRNVFFNDVDPCLNEMFSEQMGDLSNVENIFESFAKASQQGVSGEEGSGNFFENTMNQEELKDHLSGLMGGKIGSLAKEIAEEASKEFGFEEGQDEKSQSELLQQFFKNPSKLLGVVKNIGGKLEEKLKSGQMKESELMKEAQEIMGKMKDMPGMKNMMSQMGMAGGNFDMKGMANKMQQSMNQSKMKERMQEKLRKNKEEKQKEAMAGNMTQVSDDTFVWNDDNSNPNESLHKSKATNKKSTTNPKKKKKKKKKSN